MTNFLDQRGADRRDAAERRGQPRRRRPTRALKAVTVLAALALLVIGATRLVDRESSERVAAEPTPTPMPLTTPTVGVATAGDPAFLDLLATPLEAAFALATPLGGSPGADPSLGTVVLYRPSGERMAQYVGFVAKIDRVEPLTPDDEARIDPSLRDTAVVAVYGIDDTERLLRDPDVCAPASAAGD